MPAPKLYHGVVFDMDGVIADSEPVFYAAINATLEPMRLHMDEALQRRIMGSQPRDTWRLLAEALHMSQPLDELLSFYIEITARLLGEVRETLPGVRELIDALRSRQVPIGLASSSLPSWIEALLRGVGLTDSFDTVVSASMVTRGKPAPDIYLLAAERLRRPAGECLAIEDTPTGIASAKAAGMFVIQTRSASSAFAPQASADLVLDTLEAFDLGLLAT
jgi:HAD superfamily hydrolase (TIGR01509 family)